MSEVWPSVPLGEVLNERNETPSIASSEARVISKIGFKDGKIQLRADSKTKTKMILIRPGDFVLSGINAAKGAVAIYGEENTEPIAATIHYGAYIPKKDKVDVSFLWWLLRSNTFRELLDHHLPGGIKTELKAKRLLPIPIPLPPLSEQRRIVGRLEHLASKIEEARGLRDEAATECEVITKSAARQTLNLVDTDITQLREWLDKNRDGIQTGPFGAQMGKSDFKDSGHPVLTIGNVQYGGLRLEGLKYVTEEKAKALSRFAVREGDILFARMGTVGRCCVVPPDAEGWLINYHIIRVALDQSRVYSRYVHWLIQASPDIEEYLEKQVRGATRQGVNSSIVASLPCRVPSMAEQLRIVEHLDHLQVEVDSLKQLQAQTRGELDALLPSVLDKAFRGEL